MLRTTKSILFLFCLLIGSLFSILIFSSNANAAINSQINFQGKLTNPDSTNVSNGTYSIVFSIYTVSSGGTAVWTETQSSVSLVDGIFQVSLGSVTPLPGSVDFNSSSLYLGIKVGADPEMTPRVQFTSSPYAFNSDKLNGISSSGFIQLGPAGAQTDSTTNSGIFINKTGASGNILELQKAGSDVFSVGNSGLVQLTSSSYQSNFVTINDGNSGATPTIPSASLPSLTIRTKETSGSRPLFFGYDTGTGSWDSFLSAGSCGAFTNMCLDLGQGTTSFTALENTGTTLKIGGGDDGNFTNLSFLNSGTATFNSAEQHNLAGTQQLKVAATSAPIVDQVAITNAGFPTSTANVNGLSVNYTGAAAAVEAAGMRVDYTPGTLTGGTWSGLRIVAGATGSASGVNSYGIKLEGPTSTGTGSDTAIKIASGWDLGLDVGSGGLQLAAQANPTAPTTGNLKIYAKTVSGRTMLKALSPNGVDYPLQPSLFQNQVSIINVQSGVASNFFGTNRAVTGTGVTAAFSEDFGYMAGYSTTTTANTSAGISNVSNQFARGSKAGANGFFMNIRGSLQDAGYGAGATGTRMFIGMTDQTTTTSVASQNPTGNRVGFSFDTGRGDTNWMVSTRDGTIETLSNTGMLFSPAKAYDWYIFTPPFPNNNTIYWRIDNQSDDTTAEGSVTTNLPAGATSLKASLGIRNLNGTARSISYQRIYVESDR